MAIGHKVGIFSVAAALLAVTVGCGSSNTVAGGPSETAPAAATEEGKQKVNSPKLNSGVPLNAAEKGAIMSAKGHGEP